MIKLLPNMQFGNNVFVACSGGADSVALACFLGEVFTKKPHTKRRKVTLVYFNHGTKHAVDAELFVKQLAIKYSWGFLSANYYGKHTEGEWRAARYDYFKSLGQHIYTAHHLNDCVENWIMTACHGAPTTIPSRNKRLVSPCHVIRPFLLNPKSVLIKYLQKNNQDWIEDPSNAKNEHARNVVRNELLPLIAKINPNIESSIAKIVSLDCWVYE